MFRGSPGLSATQLAAITAAMGGDFDAETRQTVTQYFYVVPSQDLDVALHISAVRMRGVLDSDSLWHQERGAIEQEVARDLSNPEYLFETELRAALFAGTPYAHDPLGTRASFDRTSGAMLHQFYQRWYGPNNALLVVAGDVDPLAALDTVRQLFATIPTKPIPTRPSITLQPVESSTLRLGTDLPYSLVVAGFRLPGSNSPDYAPMLVLAAVLNNSRGALQDLAASGQALGAGFEFDGLPAAGMGDAFAAGAEGDNADSLLALVQRTLAQEVAAGFSADLVDAAKRSTLTVAEERKNSVFGLATTWSDALGVDGRASPDEDVAAVQRVTVADVNRVAREYLDQTHAVFGVLLPQQSGRPISSAQFGGTESFAPQEARPVALPGWAQSALGQLTVPPSTLHPIVDTLPNGITLVVQPETVSNTVTLLGQVKHKPELATPPGEDGVDEVLEGLFDYGTTTLDRSRFYQALDEIGAEASAGSEFSLVVLRDHFARGVELLADAELHPALPDSAFQIVQRQTAGADAGLLQTPDHLFSRAVDEALWPAGDPALREATPTTISSLTLANVHDYYGQVFRPDLTSIVVIGNVDPDTARAVVLRSFGAWRAQGPQPATDLPPVPPSGPSTVQVPNASRVQDEVVLTETLGLTRSDSDYFALELGNEVLGGGFYASRLYHDLREQRGLVYSVQSRFEIGRTRSVYRAEYAADPVQVAHARAILVRDLTAMAKTPVSPHELAQAQALLLREITLGEASEHEIAAGLLDRCIRGLPLDEPTRAGAVYLRLTAADVQHAFAEWVRPADLVQVIEGPASSQIAPKVGSN